MAQTESKIKLIFEGAERGVAAAAAKASRAVKSLDDEHSKLSKSADKAESALMGVGKGLALVGAGNGAVAVVGGVAAAATQASGALLLMPGAMAAVKIGLGVLSMGAGDFMDAMSNLGDNKAFKKNMEAMGDTAKGVAGQIKIAYDQLADGLDEKMFAGIEDKLKPLIAATLPQLDKAFDSIAKSANRTGLEILDALNKSNRQADINQLISDSSAIWDQLLKSVVPVGEAFLDVAVVGSGALKDMTSGIGAAARRFADFIARARESGQIRKWIDQGVQAFKDLSGIVGDIGSTIGSVFKGLGVDMGSPLGKLHDLTSRMAEFMKTAGAQEGLKRLGDALKVIGEAVGAVAAETLKQLGATLVAVAPAAAEVAKTLGDLLVGALRILGPMIQGVAYALGEFPGVVSAATIGVVGFVAAMKLIKTVNAVSELIGIGAQIVGLGDKAKAASGGVGGFAGKLGLLKGLGVAAVLGAAAIAMDKVNASSEGGNLSGWNGELHDLQRIMTGDWGHPFDDLNAQLDQWKRNLQTGFNTDGSSNIGKFFGWIKQQMNTPLPPLRFNTDTGPAQSQVAAFMNDLKGRTGSVNIDGRTEPAAQALADIVQQIAQGRSEIVIDGQTMPAQDALRYVTELINNSAGMVDVNGNLTPAGEAFAGFLARVNGSTGVATLAVNHDPADTELTRFLGQANAATGTTKLASNPGQANATLAGWTGSANATTATAQLRANDASARSTVGGFQRWASSLVVTVKAVLQKIGFAEGGPVPHFAAGGAVRGPGGPTSDRVPAMLSAGEHVFTAEDVRNAGGHGAILKIREMLAGKGGASPMSATAAAAVRPAPRPTAASSTGTQVTFAGNTSDALATVIMSMVRTGKIQIKAA